MELPQLSQETIQGIRTLVSTYFKNKKGEPFVLTDGQCAIFYLVTESKYRWVWISAPTRYGKTEVIAIAYIYLAVFEHVKIPVVGGSEEKAEKIMQYVVQHIGDHPELSQGLINISLSEIEKLKISVSKTALRWVDGGWIFVTSIESRSISKEAERVVGEGGDVIGLEEAGLIKEEAQYSKVVRMAEEDNGWGKLLMSGNCIENSIFEKAWNNPLFVKLRISLEQAIAEGRFTEEYLEEKKGETTTKDWKRYYLVLFPLANEFTYFKPKKYEIIPRQFDEHGQEIPLKYYGAIDPSLGQHKEGEEAKGSKIGIVVLAKDSKGQPYEIESIIKHLTPDQAIRLIFNFPYKFEKFAFEAVQFQKYFLDVTKSKGKELGIYIPFVGIQQSRNKSERIESLEPHINNGNILFKGDNQLWNDMQDYPNTEFLDGLDALESCFRLMQKKQVSIAIGDEMY